MQLMFSEFSVVWTDQCIGMYVHVQGPLHQEKVDDISRLLELIILELILEIQEKCNEGQTKQEEQ